MPSRLAEVMRTNGVWNGTRPTGSEERAEDRRYFPGDTTQTRVTLAQAAVEFFDRSLRTQHLSDQRPLPLKAVAVRMPRVRPVAQQTRAHVRGPPEQPPVLEPSHVVVVGVWSPHIRGGIRCARFFHASIIARQSAEPKLPVPDRGVRCACAWARTGPLAKGP
jgi:hypothetical protein